MIITDGVILVLIVNKKVMKSSYIVIGLLNIFICLQGKSQNTNIGNSANKEWRLEVEKTVFDKLMDYEHDSISFIEAYLIFKVSSENTVEKSFLLVNSNQIDSVTNIRMLYSHPFFLGSLAKESSAKKEIFYIQPILYGKTKDINNVVTEPSFYHISTIPISPIFNNNDNSKTIILFNQINYTYRVGR